MRTAILPILLNKNTYSMTKFTKFWIDLKWYFSPQDWRYLRYVGVFIINRDTPTDTTDIYLNKRL